MAVPHYPLTSDTWDGAELEAIQRVVRSNLFTMGPEVEAFEHEFARYFGANYAIMVNSGSSANLLAIAGLVFHPDRLLRPDDEVIVPAVSWSTTYYPLHQYRLRLRFVDVDADTLNFDLDKLSSAITPATKAVFAVNLLGNPNDFDRLRSICDSKGLFLIEDNCESMGAKFNGQYTGTFGICGTFSTFYSHHISTMEGGLIVTDDPALYHVLLSLRAHGWTREQPKGSHLSTQDSEFVRLFRFVLPGYNLRPLEMSGAIGREQLKKLPRLIEQRRRNAKVFQRLCGDIEGVRIQRETGDSSWFSFALLLEGRLAGRRADLVELLQDSGIEVRPIVAGNFLKNPVMKYIDHTVGSSIEAADKVDENGLFIGNHPFDLSDLLADIRSLLFEFAARWAT